MWWRIAAVMASMEADRAARLVSVEMRDAVLEGLRDGFAHVVKQGGPHELRRAPGGVAEQEHGVDEDVALGMILLRLFHAAHGVDFRQDDPQDAEIGEHFEAFRRMRTEQDLFEFGADAFGGDEAEFSGGVRGGLRRRGIGRESEPGCEPDEPEDAEVVLAEADHGIADGAEDARAEVVEAADAVDDLFRGGVEEQAVDREVAAGHVQLFVVRVDHMVGAASVAVAAFRAECRDLDGDIVDDDHDDAEGGADGDRPFEQRLDLFRAGGRGDVDVVRGASEQEVADGSAHEKGFMARGAEHGGGFRCCGEERRPRKIPWKGRDFHEKTECSLSFLENLLCLKGTLKAISNNNAVLAESKRTCAISRKKEPHETLPG